MAVGDFLSTKAQNEYNRSERARESWEVENHPAGEKQELIEIYREKGIDLEDANKIVDTISKYPSAWVDIMMVEELSIVSEEESPLKNSAVTFISFSIFGFIPLAAYVVSRFVPVFGENTFMVASFLTGVTLFILGSLKYRFTLRNPFVSGLEMLIVGGLASGAAYLIGILLSGLA